MNSRQPRLLLWRLVALGAISATLALPLSAWAADFTVRVPVKVDSLPEGASPSVYCRAVSADSNIGEGEAPVPVEDGVYEGTVEIEVNAFDGVDPELATEVYCLLAIGAGQVIQYDECVESGMVPSDYPLDCAARGIKVTSRVEGPIAETLPQ